MTIFPPSATPPHDLPSAQFARSALGGKRNSRIEARVTDETKMELARRCHQLGITESDFVTALVETSLFGVDHVLMVQRERLVQVCGRSGLIPGEPA